MIEICLLNQICLNAKTAGFVRMKDGIKDYYNCLTIKFAKEDLENYENKIEKKNENELEIFVPKNQMIENYDEAEIHPMLEEWDQYFINHMMAYKELQHDDFVNILKEFLKEKNMSFENLKKFLNDNHFSYDLRLLSGKGYGSYMVLAKFYKISDFEDSFGSLLFHGFDLKNNDLIYK